MDSIAFVGERKIINLTEAVEVANKSWDSMNPYVSMAYEDLMANEAYWSYPSHHEFSRLVHWHQLGNA